MERNCDVSKIDSCYEKKHGSVEKFLNEVNLSEQGGSLNYSSFRSVCLKLFPQEEVERDEWRIREIFDSFDSNKDGVLEEEEWKRFCEWLQVTLEPTNALLVVDVQNDFIDGSLALRSCAYKQDGADVLEPINHLIKNGRFHKIIYSLDWHPDNHISFYETLYLRDLHPDSKVTKENAKLFDKVIFADPYLEQILWPKHCVMDTWGAQLHENLVIAPSSEQVCKGQDPDADAYSVFYDNNSKGSLELQSILRKSAVTHIYVCGLAYDVCVRATSLDGLRLGYALAVIDDCCRGVDEINTENAKTLIRENGGLIANSDEVLAMVNEGKRSLVMSHQYAKMMATSILCPESSADGSC